MTQDQETKLNEVHAAIVGNKAIGHKGLVQRVEEVETYAEKDKKFKNRLAGGVAVGTVLGGGLWQWILKNW